jgi:hypothetical protein
MLWDVDRLEGSCLSLMKQFVKAIFENCHMIKTNAN